MAYVTDLHRFSRCHVWRPFWPWHPDYDGKRLTDPPMGLARTAEELAVPSKWRDAVICRLVGCRITFAPYVVHPLVSVVSSLMDEHECDRHQRRVVAS